MSNSKHSSDSLGDRIKTYEAVSDIKLTRRTPVILRIDGCHFHSFTKKFAKPFDMVLIESMQRTMLDLCKNIQGCVFGYTQSDEITLVLCDYQTINTAAWFDYRVSKMCSVAASMASRFFNLNFIAMADAYTDLPEITDDSAPFPIYCNVFNTADFDCRAFNVPINDVCNCLIWRQQDAERNSILSVAQSQYKPKEMQGVSCKKLVEKLKAERDINWEGYNTYLKRGTACVKDTEGKWQIDKDMPKLSENREYVESRIIFAEDWLESPGK